MDKFWEILLHAAYSQDLALSDYYSFSSMGHALAEQDFTSYENGSMTGLPQKTNNFFGEVSINYQTDGKNV